MSMRGTSTVLQQPPPKVSNHAEERCSVWMPARVQTNPESVAQDKQTN